MNVCCRWKSLGGANEKEPHLSSVVNVTIEAPALVSKRRSVVVEAVSW